MKKIILAVFLISLAAVSSSQLKSGYEIDVTISGLQDSTIYLAYHLGDKQYLKDTVKLDKAGHTIIKGNEPLPYGIYMIVLPQRTYFEILISEDQQFKVITTYKDFITNLRFEGSVENSAFLEYQRQWSSMQQKALAVSKRLQSNKQNNDSLKVLSELQKNTEKEMIAYLKSVANLQKGQLLTTLVKALIPIEVPEFRVPDTSQNPDSVRWVMNYNYNKDHFFDNISLTNESLLRTPILQSRLDAFFTNVVIQAPDSINKEIDKIIKKCSSNYKVFQFIAVYLFNHFRESQVMGHDAVMVKLADDIYLSGKADWVSKEFKDDLRKQIELIRPTLIGKKAHDLVMNSYKDVFVSLYDVEKDFTILYFWEPDCGHCIESTPKLKAYYENAKNEGIEVFAICTTAEKEKWSKYIQTNNLTWINGWDPQRTTRFDLYYNIQSTPMIYILDKNKKIIAKKISVEDIGPFIENYRKYQGI
jgi:thiol-disulfide isomerase/thioredoxin